MLNITVVGALIGKQRGRNLEIMNSFELVVHIIDNEFIVDKEYYNTKEDQCVYFMLCLYYSYNNYFFFSVPH